MKMPKIEWICTGLALIVTLATLVIIASDLGQAEDKAPEIMLTVEGIDRQHDGYVVRIRAQNISGATAAAYRIEGLLRRDGEVVEQSQATFDYVPRGSVETGGLWFKEDPSALDLELRSMGYQEP